MTEHNHSGHKPPSTGSFLRSRVGVVLIISLAVAGLFLVYEHRIHIFAGNWILALFPLLCIVMHQFMHGGHGGHGGRNRGPDNGERP